MFSRLILIAIVLTIFSNCNKKEIKGRTFDNFQKKEIDTQLVINKKKLKNKELSINQNALEIDTVAVLFFEPSIEDIDQLKKNAGGDDEFEQVVMDNQYYQYEAKEYFKDKPVKMYSSQAEIFIFKISNRKNEVISKKSLENSWGMFFFNQKESPIQINEAGDFQESAKLYFKW